MNNVFFETHIVIFSNKFWENLLKVLFLKIYKIYKFFSFAGNIGARKKKKKKKTL
jgi:hypothetical protein